MEPITAIAAKAGIPEEYVECYGKYKAKVSDKYYNQIKDRPDAKLILVTAVNPTPAGEGKTTAVSYTHLDVYKRQKKMNLII